MLLSPANYRRENPLGAGRAPTAQNIWACKIIAPRKIAFKRGGERIFSEIGCSSFRRLSPNRRDASCSHTDPLPQRPSILALRGIPVLEVLHLIVAVSVARKKLILPNKPIPISGQSSAPDVNLWDTAEHALDYLKRADTIPHRTEGEAVLLGCLPQTLSRVLDLGSGGGRLLSLVKLARPETEAVAVDFSPTMLDQLRERFGKDSKVQIVAQDLERPLPPLGTFDAVVSSFAIHHLRHERKRSLYTEIYRLLTPGGVFCNLEHVASPTETLHRRFLAALAVRPEDEDPSNKLLDLETQLGWLREIGFTDVDCHWKWLELALLVGAKPIA